jgi:nucleoside-diphosphate-sugar epimerase
VQALAAPEAACGAIYHIGSGRGLSVRELAREVAGILGRPELVRFGRAETADSDIPRLVADPRLAQRTLGWNPDPDLESRVRAAVEWWLERMRGRTPRC